MVDEAGRDYQFVWPIIRITLFEMMKLNTGVFFVLSLIFISCSREREKSEMERKPYSVQDFFTDNPELDSRVNAVFESLDNRERIGQMIVTSAGTHGKPRSVVEKLIKNKAIGGILLLGGEKGDLIALGRRFDSLGVASGALPFIYSSDAEPSLLNRKISGTQTVPKTVELLTVRKCDSVANIISNELRSMNIRHNFAPVLDMSPRNAAITNRTFGNDSATVVKLASAFARTTQSREIVATAKHFPGHGLVSGDTHNQLVSIDGALLEVPNYKPLIAQGVMSVMVGHIAVINNEKYQTDGLPASCSRVIVTDLLKNEMNFKGIVVTDAMNMGALAPIDKASLKAVQAGCDMILMEPKELLLIDDIYELYQRDSEFKLRVDASVRKILRLKICLDLL
jgi:beta-N-acetylhexosaminidase